MKAALVHPNAAGLSDGKIAKHVGVDHKTVLSWREKLELSREIPQIATRTVTRGGTTYQQNTANIGRKPEPDKSNCAIAKHVGVDEGTVRSWREKLTLTSEIPKSVARTGADGRTTLRRNRV
ncbi:MAG TPA: hypothetical protein VN538_00030 [Clostridia bacterium]|nr:hypothetical protein [Clostridia bacterium]